MSLIRCIAICIAGLSFALAPVAQGQGVSGSPVVAAPVQPPPVGPLPGIYSLAFSLDGKRLAVGTHKQVLLYDTTQFTVADTITKVHNAVRSIAFHPDGKHYAIGSGVAGSSGDVVMCDMTDPTQLLLRHSASTIFHYNFAGSGKTGLGGDAHRRSLD